MVHLTFLVHVYMINARSVRNKAETICDYITERDFDIICLTKTWLSENYDAVIHALTPDEATDEAAELV